MDGKGDEAPAGDQPAEVVGPSFFEPPPAEQAVEKEIKGLCRNARRKRDKDMKKLTRNTMPKDWPRSHPAEVRRRAYLHSIHTTDSARYRWNGVAQLWLIHLHSLVWTPGQANEDCERREKEYVDAAQRVNDTKHGELETWPQDMLKWAGDALSEVLLDEHFQMRQLKELAKKDQTPKDLSHKRLT